MYDLKHRWNLRTKQVADLILPNSTILDIGCADKDFLNFYKAKDYLGIDKTDKADIQLDLDQDIYVPYKNYDYCLILGVLEYLDYPDKIVNFYKKYADATIILFSNKKSKKALWKNFFSKEQKIELIKTHFTEYEVIESPGFVIFKCNKLRT
jgi:hypothetical protein